ncbi:hypothetical protein COB21_04090 [Candidatus Aerophobetes bacterium]|uniref:Undecaprenyldiphospho-muramoylpentapeptide beta-N-acetylglucosaminyltransferase n=1 Tax=Aerophobetes bacterium TaxID=2030807 RepID=A0A2A4X291_UNCAE|nr:MAG: hypothetical protein COB21_04090 [Candidatus Aerophobetes bacterium]
MSLKSIPHVVFAVGGSGGHLFLAKSLAGALLNKSALTITFAGPGENASLKGNFKLEGIKQVKVASPAPSLKRILPFSFKFLKGLLSALKLLRQTKPALCIGFGSYHSVTTLLAARLLKVPIVLFEANFFPGKVNRLFSNQAVYTAALFSQAKMALKGEVKTVRFIPKHKPLKSLPYAEAKKQLGLDPNMFTFLIFGGSQGASFINKLVMDSLLYLENLPANFQIIHSVGKLDDIEKIKACYAERGVRAHLTRFIEDMSAVYRASDACISRSGALSVLEQIEYNKPSILIPFAKASDNHQAYNAFFMQEFVAGGVVVLEKGASGQILLGKMLDLSQHGSLEFQTMQESIIAYKAGVKRANFEDLIMQDFDIKSLKGGE